jgi:hypothetical protein
MGRPLRRRKIATPGMTVELDEYPMPPVQLGRLKPLPDARALCINLLEMQQSIDEPLDGVIGMDFLRRHILQFDFDAQKLRFLKAVPTDAGDSFALRAGPMQDIPYIELTVGDIAAVFIIDTGCSSTMSANSNLFNQLDKSGHVGIRSTGMFSSAGGLREQVYGRLDTLTLGQFIRRDLILDRHSRLNSFGFSYLKHFIVTFDFPKHLMHLKAGKAFDQPESWDLSGLHIWRVKGEIVIDGVDAGSPSESVNLQKNDVFVLVNDLPIAQFSLTRLRAMLRDPTRSVALTIRRGEEMKRVELLPQEFRTKAGSALVSPQADPGP